MNFMFEWQEQYLTSERSERVVPYLCRICAVFWRAHRASQNTNNEYKFSAILHNKTSDKRFIIQHPKLLCPWGRILRGMRDRRSEAERRVIFMFVLGVICTPRSTVG